MRFPLLTLLLACLVLSGCWRSQGLLLDTNRGYADLQATQYQATGGGKALLLNMGRGWYQRVTDDGADLLFVERLQGDVIVVAVAEVTCKDAPSTCTWRYSPARLSGGVITVIGTDNPEAKALAVARGANCLPDNNTCDFGSRAALVAAVTDQVYRGPVTGTWRPVGF